MKAAGEPVISMANGMPQLKTWNIGTNLAASRLFLKEIQGRHDDLRTADGQLVHAADHQGVEVSGPMAIGSTFGSTRGARGVAQPHETRLREHGPSKILGAMLQKILVVHRLRGIL